MNMPLTRRIIHGAMLATLITLSASYASTPTSESTGQFVNNSVLTSKVKAALAKVDVGDADFLSLS
ncbi:MAG: ABC-type transporter Mla maintaining outer membrane lipid asymmetry permease subunit MlaE [Granulosicoccus sp.]|jgi:ABC-type transporter Mla maintaining outer membrane lipid asymmetry permease subunit MlaE